MSKLMNAIFCSQTHKHNWSSLIHALTKLYKNKSINIIIRINSDLYHTLS